MEAITQGTTPVEILFCDIDDTLTSTISGHKFKQHPKDVKPLPGAVEGVAKYASNGYKVFGISNQGGIEAGFKTLENTIAEMQYTLELFSELDSILFCPDFAGSLCMRVFRETPPWNYMKLATEPFSGFRKPGIGMVNNIMQCMAFGLDSCISADVDFTKYIDYKNSLFIGDRPEDEECAKNANIPFMRANDWLLQNQ